ncbi:MAG: isocitrate lyase/phosphoenolpyruvate mutase family protein [Robiginitomaculum sp.]|nr:isocitrate lyase/phosphoenolpyruvate mutase family protein [Robiginitomaculum sp.]
MTTASNKIKAFRDLHVRGDPLVLYNIWDAGTAKIVADAGAQALATGSASVAGAHGYADGEKLRLGVALRNLKLIIDAVDIPVSIDLESGYGTEPRKVADTVLRAIELGAVGFNLEDQVMGAGALYGIKEQAARIAACRTAVDGVGISAFINAHTDVFLQAGADAQMEALLEDVMQRAQAYHNAGADGLFVPGLIDKAAIKTLCENAPMPVNIMVLPGCPDIEGLAKLGVARISHGPSPYQTAMQTITAGAKALYA